MKKPMRKLQWRNLLLGFSPWMLAIACVLLILVLTLFTVSNYQREKYLINEALTQKGLTLFRFINSSARESMRDNIRRSDNWIPWQKHIQAAMDQAVEQPGVDSVQLIDEEGLVIAAAGQNIDKNSVDERTLALAKTLSFSGQGPFVSRIIREKLEDAIHLKFQLIAWHMAPNMPRQFFDPFEHGPGRGPMMRRFSSHPQSQEIQEDIRRLLDRHLMFVVKLDYEQFNTGLKRQILQVIILSIVTLLVGIAGALSYITLRGLRGSQQSLGEMRAFTDILVSSLPIGLIATDSEGVIQVCNEAAGNILEINPALIRLSSPAVGLPPAVAAMFVIDERPDLQDGRNKEIVLNKSSGRKATLHLAGRCVVDRDGRLAGQVLLIQDLTDVKALEIELQRSERLAALGKMAAGVAHELRNPLSSIKGLAMLLKTELLTVDGDIDTADVLVKEVERLNRSIGELLDYARPGQLKLEPTNLHDLVHKTVSLIQVDAESYAIRIQLELAENLPQLYIDKDKLSQVFLNLFLNAIQAMPNGGVLTIRTKLDQFQVITEIHDTGEGIAPEHMQRVFDPYFTTKSEGTGLGLALSSKIIEEHGGAIKIDSLLGSFTNVTIILPIQEKKEELFVQIK